MKNPFQQGLELYQSRPDLHFLSDLAAHAAGGHILISPQVFAMIRPVVKTWEPWMLAKPDEFVARDEDADCWFVWILCGSLKEAVKHLPYRLPWVGFAQRGQPARFMELEKALSRIPV